MKGPTVACSTYLMVQVHSGGCHTVLTYYERSEQTCRLLVAKIVVPRLAYYVILTMKFKWMFPWTNLPSNRTEMPIPLFNRTQDIFIIDLITCLCPLSLSLALLSFLPPFGNYFCWQPTKQSFTVLLTFVMYVNSSSATVHDLHL